ncbi:AAA family ATPase [Peptoniphilus mikwangii]|uniref:ATPase n=1 Tax=Peptoniphilus mikwangii TaxID=1354300 RepID=UPI000426B11E|nr:ATPase [Peptoniphilus mikwangii]
MDLNILESKINRIEKNLNIDKGKLEILNNNLSDINSEIKSLIEYDDILSKVIILFQKTSSYGRNQARKQIEELVTKCLQFVFETDIEFIIEITENGKIPQAEFYVLSNYDEYKVKTKPELSRGGGVVDIISIALRIAFIQLYKPEIKGPIILDEPGKHVSNDYIFNLGEFLRQASSMFRRQIIMVTHNSHLSQICDISYTVEIKNGKSVILQNEELS